MKPAVSEHEVLVSVVVPVKDNAATLAELVERLEAVLSAESHEIVLIDDGSEDGSWAELERLARSHATVKPYALARNYGQQAALCAGFEMARGRVIITLDADLQYPPEAIPTFLEAWRGGHDLVCGHRVVRDDPFVRRVLPSRLFNVLVRWVTGSRVRDVGCALNAIDASILEGLPQCGERRRFLKPLLAEQARHLTQRPVEATRRAGRSSYGFVRLAALAIDFFVVYSARPFRWLLVTGGIVAILASVLLLTVVTWNLLLGGVAPWLPWVGGSLIALFFGFHLATIGLLGESQHRLAAEREGRAFYRFRTEERP